MICYPCNMLLKTIYNCSHILELNFRVYLETMVDWFNKDFNMDDSSLGKYILLFSEIQIVKIYL